MGLHMRYSPQYFPGFLGLGFCRKLTHTKIIKAHTKQSNITDKQYFCAYQQVYSTSSYNLSSIHLTSSLFLPTPFFIYATEKVRHHLSLGRSCVFPPNFTTANSTRPILLPASPLQETNMELLFGSN